VAPYVRTVRTASGSTAVQIVHSSRQGSRDIEHIGSAKDAAGIQALKAVAQERLRGGQEELDLGVSPAAAAADHDKPISPEQTASAPGIGAGVLPVTSSRMEHLWLALEHAYRRLGLENAAQGDEVFAALVLARIIEPTSKLDSIRVLEEAGVTAPSYATIKRRLPQYAKTSWQERLSRACADRADLGPASLVLYDVSTLYFETDAGDGFREPGFSKERRLEPQITIGLLTDASGNPLALNSFEGNKSEKATIVPSIKTFMKAYRLSDVTIVADAGMISAANLQDIENEGLSFIIGAKTPDLPYQVKKWQKDNPGKDFQDGQIFTQPWPAGATDKRRDQIIYHQYTDGRARRTLRGIDEQIAKAQKAVEGKIPVKKNRFVKLSGGTKTVNTALEAKARSLAGLKGYTTNLTHCPDGTPVTPEYVIGAYHRLFEIERSFRMSKHDLQARPIYHRTRESIDAHLSIVFAALAISRWIEATTGWSIRKFVRTARRYRTIQIQAGQHTLTAADPVPVDLRTALDLIHGPESAH
jgi:hypothetical protein